MTSTLAIGGTAVPLALTMFALGGTGSLEGEQVPGSAYLIANVGWAGTAAVSLGFLILTFALYRRVNRWGYSRTARAGMWSLAIMGVANTINDAFQVYQYGFAHTDVSTHALPLMVMGAMILLSFSFEIDWNSSESSPIVIQS